MEACSDLASPETYRYNRPRNLSHSSTSVSHTDGSSIAAAWSKRDYRSLSVGTISRIGFLSCKRSVTRPAYDASACGLRNKSSSIEAVHGHSTRRGYRGTLRMCSYRTIQACCRSARPINLVCRGSSLLFLCICCLFFVSISSISYCPDSYKLFLLVSIELRNLTNSCGVLNILL